MILVALSLSIAAIGPCVADESGLHLEIDVGKPDVRQCDPVTCRLRLINVGDEDVTFRRTLSNPGGTLRFQVREKDGAWRHLRLLGEGLAHDITIPWKLRSGASVVKYELLYVNEKGYCFPESGDYEIRAVFWTKERTLRSLPAKLTVGELPENDFSYRHEKLDELVSVAGFGLVSHKQVVDLEAIAARLTESELQRNVRWHIAVREWQLASADSTDSAYASTLRATSELSEVSRTPAAILLARLCIRSKRYDLAFKALMLADESYDEVRTLRSTCEQRKAG